MNNAPQTLIDMCEDSKVDVPNCPFEQGRMLLLAAAEIHVQAFMYRHGVLPKEEVDAIRKCFSKTVPNFTPDQEKFKALRSRLRTEGLDLLAKI